MTRAVSLKLAAANQVPVQFSREASKLSRFVIPFQPDWDKSLGAQNQSRYDLDLRKHVSLSSDEICFAAKITYALEPLFRSYRIWRYLWFNYWTEARQNGIYRLNLRSPNMVDSMMQFLSQKVWHGPLPFLRTQRRISLVCWSPTTALSHATNDHLTVRGIQHWLPAHTHNSLYLETRYSEWLRPFPVPSFFEISRIFHGQIGSTLEKQLSPLPFWEILLRALIPHKQTSIIQSANVWICL